MKKAKDYQALSLELEEVLAELQQPAVSVDQAVKLYERGLVLIAELETQLEQAENKIDTLKLAFEQKGK
jgi:exodeoxyribonuclease VII small subunit